MKATALKALFLTLLGLSLAACSPASAVGRLAPQVRSHIIAPLTQAAAQTASSSPSSPSSTSTSTTQAIQAVIQRGNDEQARALASGNPAVMQDTSAASYYQDLTRINQQLRDAGVTAIQLRHLGWGPVTVNGSTATATTYESWSTTYSDGTTDQSTDRNVYSLVLENGSWKIRSDDHPDDGYGAPPPAVQPGGQGTAPQTGPAPNAPVGRGQSRNWSGYAATGGQFTAVTGTWTVPQPQPNGADGTDAAWVGIGGVTSRDLIQAGTEETVLDNGHVQYQAWIETLPQASRPVPLSVAPGDSVTVAISQQSGGDWRVSFKNNTSGATYSRDVQYDSSLSSAEWVEEAPSAGRGVLPLDNFGSVSFSGASAVENGKTVNLSQAHAQPITMINGAGQALATPSAVSSSGDRFSVTRTPASSTAGEGAPGYIGGRRPGAGIVPGDGGAPGRVVIPGTAFRRAGGF